MINFGFVPAFSVLPVMFGSYDGATGASEALTGLAVGDIKIYKGTSMTERASTAGYTLLDTDGIDIDSMVGINGFSINLGDDSDAGFYANGSFYTVVVSSVTIDGQMVNFVAASFRIAGVDVGDIAGAVWDEEHSIHTTPGSFGRSLGGPDTAPQSVYKAVVTDAAGTNIAADIIDIEGKVDDLETRLGTPSDLGSGATVAANLVDIEGQTDNLPAIETKVDDLPTNAELATALDALPTASENADAVWDEALAGHQTPGSAGEALDAAGAGGSNPLVLASGTVGPTGNTTTTVHLDGLTYANDEINGLQVVILDASTSTMYAREIRDWVLATELATVDLLPFTPVSGDSYWLLAVPGNSPSGPGALERTLRILQNGFPVEGASVWVTTDSQGLNVIASGTTDSMGIVTVLLDAGTFYLWMQRDGYQPILGQAFTVS